MTDSEKLDVLLRKVERMEKLHAELLLKRPTMAEQAKEAGVTRVTLWRRRKRAKLEAMANGRL
jgi:transcriptional regulator of acetoin/glycerol metabolism